MRIFKKLLRSIKKRYDLVLYTLCDLINKEVVKPYAFVRAYNEKLTIKMSLETAYGGG